MLLENEAMQRPIVRNIKGSDLTSIVRLQDDSAPGWNQTIRDWELLIEGSPNECLCIKEGWDVIATATGYVYSNELAWVGLVLVHPNFRRRGLGTCILQELIRRLRLMGVLLVKLDATNMGIELYRQLGFVEDCAIERWERLPGPVICPGRMTVGKFTLHAALDRRAFGIDRSELLSHLSRVESGSFCQSGFAMGRPGKHARYFGPCVAESRTVAEELTCWFVQRHLQDKVFWDILDRSHEAARLAGSLGFSQVRRLTRMSLCHGAVRPGSADPGLIYATAGFEYG